MDEVRPSRYLHVVYVVYAAIIFGVSGYAFYWFVKQALAAQGGGSTFYGG